MQKISIDNLKPGMITNKNIFDANGTLLLGAGAALNDDTIDRLGAYNLGSVYIKNPLLDFEDEYLENDIDNVTEMIREDTRRKAVKTMRASLKNIYSTTKIDIDSIGLIASLLVSEIFKNRNALIHLTDIRTYDDQTFAHSVNVATMATLIGVRLGYEKRQLLELAIGALLHDVGKLMIPPEILTKQESLTDEEFSIVKQHADWGFEILRKNKGVPLLSAHVAYQHHEKYNGGGYVRSIKGEEIHEYARIVSIADVYEALISDRHYRKGYIPHEAYEIMLDMSNSSFDLELLAQFFSQLIIYPVGTTIRLSNGMLAIVEKILPKFQLMPVIRVIAEYEDDFLMDKSFRLDLRENLNITITKVLPEEEVCELIRSYKEKLN